jgi:hypothetical protein
MAVAGDFREEVVAAARWGKGGRPPRSTPVPPPQLPLARPPAALPRPPQRTALSNLGLRRSVAALGISSKPPPSGFLGFFSGMSMRGGDGLGGRESDGREK